MKELISFIRKTLNIREEIDENTPLLTSGLVDSFKAVVLISALESRYGIQIETDDLDADNLDTPAQIYSFVQGRQA